MPKVEVCWGENKASGKEEGVVVEGKFGVSWAPQIKRLTLARELVLVLALALLRQMILGKSLPLWALVSPSENRPGGADNARGGAPWFPLATSL